ncbi:MAG TPA: DUF2092 domain-containing protein [Syntrophobacter fumaroxidans]|nr:DUF2092 domain-containing protein [Syntrophobacter fumaroxidans]
MIKKGIFSGLCLATGLFLLTAWPAMGQQKAAEPSAAGEDAGVLLNKAAHFLSTAGQFSVVIRSGFDVVQLSGQKIEYGEVRKVTLRRPDRFRADIERSDGQKGLVLFDGKDLTIFSEKDNVYARVSKPGDLDGAVIHFLKDLGMRLPLAMMYVSTLPREMDRRVRSIETVEQTTILDVPCVHLAARSDEVDFQIWIPSRGDPLPRRIVITYKLDKGQPQFRADFSEWNLSPNPSDAVFVFSAPPDARQIPFLAQVKAARPEPAKAKPGKKKGGKQ